MCFTFMHVKNNCGHYPVTHFYIQIFSPSLHFLLPPTLSFPLLISSPTVSKKGPQGQISLSFKVTHTHTHNSLKDP